MSSPLHVLYPFSTCLECSDLFERSELLDGLDKQVAPVPETPDRRALLSVMRSLLLTICEGLYAHGVDLDSEPSGRLS